VETFSTVRSDLIGFHRDTFYEVRHAFQTGGVAALVESRRGMSNELRLQDVDISPSVARKRVAAQRPGDPLQAAGAARARVQVKNQVYYATGLVILILNKIRHTILGYRRPRPFPSTEFMKATEHDCSVVARWMSLLERYLGVSPSLEGMVILELGPGPDLGVGLLTLFLGAKKYNAIDIHDLVRRGPREFYEIYFKYLANNYTERNTSISALQRELELTLNGKDERLKYICDANFDLCVIEEGEIDLVLSNAAFQQFDDVSRTVSQLSKIAKQGTVFIAYIDLKTHTRWIRERDPLNIYRYGDFLYNLFRFSGSPNRLRPYEYERALAQSGWTKIVVMPITKLEQACLSSTVSYLNEQFQGDHNQMDYLGIAVCATKA